MTLRKVFFWSHLVLGLALGLFILSACVTGTILAFAPQITAWSERDVAKAFPPTPESQRLSVDDLLFKAQQAKPEVKLSFISFKSAPDTSVTVGLGRDGYLFMDPYTGSLLGTGSKTRELLHEIEDWHRHLLIKDWGEYVTASSAFVYFLLSLSGIYLWWPRKTFTLKGTGKTRDWNWHNTFGLATLPIVWLITITGVLMVADVFPRRKPAKLEPGKTLEYLFMQAQANNPGWKTIGFRIPKEVEKGPTLFVQPPPGGRNAREWLTPLHTGRALNSFGQFLNLLAALAGILQVWTGVALSYRRFFKSKRSAKTDLHSRH